MYKVSKTYGHDLGLSAAFRQWRDTGHCSFIHGYALSIRLDFQSDTLDARNWVIGFGDLDPIKALLVSTFDHKTLVAKDDPQLDWFLEGEDKGVLDVVVMDNVGCEKFAEWIFKRVDSWLVSNGHKVKLISVEVREHGANSASYGE